MLHDNRFATGQVANGAVTDPRGLQFDIGRLGATELPARTLNIGLVHLRRAGNLARWADVHPARMVTGNFISAAPDALGGTEVKIMAWHVELPTRDPKLEEAGIDVHEGRAPEEGQQRRTYSIMEIQ